MIGPEFISKEELLCSQGDPLFILIWFARDEIPNIAFRPGNNPGNGCISEMDAPCIEYFRSIVNDHGALTQGRLWAESAYFERGTLIKKSEGFQGAYRRLASWIRHHYLKLPNVDGYVGKEAARWIRSGKPIFPPAQA